MTITLSIHLPNLPLFLFATWRAFPSVTESRELTTLRGDIEVLTDERVEVGLLRLVWEVSVEQREGDQWVDRKVLDSYEARIGQIDSVISPNTRRPGDPEPASGTCGCKLCIPFELVLPTSAAATRVTPFDRITHTMHASLLEPVPDYNKASSPAPSPRPPPKQLSPTQSPPMSRSGSSTDLPRRGSGLNLHELNLHGVGSSSRPSSPRPTTPRKAAAAGKVTHPLFRLLGVKKPRKPPAESHVEDEPEEKDEGIPLPAALKPSLASVTEVIEVIQCPKNPFEVNSIQMLSWTTSRTIPSLGQLQLAALSDLFICGSGMNFSLHMEELSPQATIHCVQVTLRQMTYSADQTQELIEEYTLYKDGQPYSGPPGKPPLAGEYIWRGELARIVDASPTANSKDTRRPSDPVVPLPLPPVKDGMGHLDGLNIMSRVRIPSPVLGLVARYADYKDQCSTTHHYLRFELFYSVMGEDAEGSLRRFWVDHHVVMADCNASPSNIIVPNYDDPEPNGESSTASTTAKAPITKAMRVPRQQTLKKLGEKDQVSYKPPANLTEAVEDHFHGTDGTCMCFKDETELAKLIGVLPLEQLAQVEEVQEFRRRKSD